MSQDSATGGARHEDGRSGGNRLGRWTATAVGATVMAKQRWQDTGRREGEGDRGDVPGWVMVTLMTAGLVAAIWGVARGSLIDMFQRALSDVKPGK